MLVKDPLQNICLLYCTVFSSACLSPLFCLYVFIFNFISVIPPNLYFHIFYLLKFASDFFQSLYVRKALLFCLVYELCYIDNFVAYHMFYCSIEPWFYTISFALWNDNIKCYYFNILHTFGFANNALFTHFYNKKFNIHPVVVSINSWGKYL